MKRLLLTVCMIFTAAITNAQVTITLVNKTGRDLDAVAIDKGKYIGAIAKDSAKTTTLAVIEMLQGRPQFNISLQYGNKQIATSNETAGITYLKRITKGDYVLDISILTDEWGKDHLYYNISPKVLTRCGNERYGRSAN
jgi:hypothetical protein